MINNIVTKDLNKDCNVAPLLLKAIGKRKIWGGLKLSALASDDGNYNYFAEIWKCSTNRAGISIIDSEPFKGLSLLDLITKDPNILGLKYLKTNDLPVIVKLIDACDRLSIQVHPSDEYAVEYEKGKLGKSEFLYILEAEKGAYVYAGFEKPITKKRLREVIEDGSIEKYLRKIYVKAGDSLYIPATMVHGIGSGVLALEVSQNSNMTYRIYDFDRLTSSGKHRELHIDKAIEVIDIGVNYENSVLYPKKEYVDRIFEDTLCKCKFFKIKKVVLGLNSIINTVLMDINVESFRIILCVEGSGVISYDNKKHILKKYDCFFVPANTKKTIINGDLVLIIIEG